MSDEVWTDEYGREAPDYSTSLFRDVYVSHVEDVERRGDWENAGVTFDNWIERVRENARVAGYLEGYRAGREEKWRH